jgi:serine/threonine protein kinase
MQISTQNPLIAFYEQISQYIQPEDLFGDLGPTQGQQLRQLDAAFKSLMKLYHPDHYVNQVSYLYYVTEITKKVNEFKREALIKIKANTYGLIMARDYQSVIRVGQRDFYVTRLLVEGALADIYHALYLDPGDQNQPRKEAVIKMIANRGMNRLVEQEVQFYQTLTQICFATYIDHFTTADGRRAVVLSYIPESYDLIELTHRYRQKYRAPGIPQEHFVWILDRFLSALGLLHENRILHGNIQPDNLLIQPKTHNGLLIDFLHCRVAPEPEDVFTAVNPRYCAPEVLTQRLKPHPVSDIYALGTCMIEMLGGSNGSLDDEVDLDPALRIFLQKMVLSDPAKRATDAWALAAELKTLRRQIYGSKHQFIPLEIGE